MADNIVNPHPSSATDGHVRRLIQALEPLPPGSDIPRAISPFVAPTREGQRPVLGADVQYLRTAPPSDPSFLHQSVSGANADTSITVTFKNDPFITPVHALDDTVRRVPVTSQVPSSRVSVDHSPSLDTRDGVGYAQTPASHPLMSSMGHAQFPLSSVSHQPQLSTGHAQFPSPIVLQHGPHRPPSPTGHAQISTSLGFVSPSLSPPHSLPNDGPALPATASASPLTPAAPPSYYAVHSPAPTVVPSPSPNSTPSPTTAPSGRAVSPPNEDNPPRARPVPPGWFPHSDPNDFPPLTISQASLPQHSPLLPQQVPEWELAPTVSEQPSPIFPRSTQGTFLPTQVEHPAIPHYSDRGMI
jgi:hypothetical protein